MGPTQSKILRSKEEAEQMASAILAAHRSPARAPIVQRRPAHWKRYLACGISTGVVVAVLPSHHWLIGALVGLAIGGITALIARAADS